MADRSSHRTRRKCSPCPTWTARWSAAPASGPRIFGGSPRLPDRHNVFSGFSGIYHSHRLAQSLARAEWLEDRRAEILDTQYFHVVFTVPEEIAAIAYQNKEIVYGILFRTAAETLRTIAADPSSLSDLTVWRNFQLKKPIKS